MPSATPAARRPLLRRLGRRAFVAAWPHLARPLSHPWAQARLEELQWAALAGMNYCVARSGHLDHSGELWVVRTVLPALARALPPGAPLQVVDVGANVGDYSRAVLAHLPPGAVALLALEPQAAPLARLRARFGHRPELCARALALGATPGRAPMWGHAGDSALASLNRRRLDHQGIAFVRQQEVAVTTLDELAAAEGIGHIHFLKLDIEGHELAALTGARGLIAEGRLDVVQFEYGAGNIEARTYFRDFWERLAPQYRLYRVLQHGLCPLPAYRETYEQLVLANYLAVARHLGAVSWVP